MTVSDISLASSGELYLLDSDGAIRFQDSNIGVDYQHMAASQRPTFLWKTIDAPPSKPTRIFAAHGGKLLALCEDGQLFERLPDRDARLIQTWRWQSVNLGEAA